MIAAYLQMGAAGVQMGTVFVCAEESTAHPAFKQAFIRAAARDAVPSVQIDPEFKVIPVRAIANNGTRRFTETQIEVIGQLPPRRDDLRGSLAGDRALLGRRPAPRGGRRRRRERLADGRPERGPGAQGSSRWPTILAEMLEQAERALARARAEPARRCAGGLMTAAGGRSTPDSGGRSRRSIEFSASRMLLRAAGRGGGRAGHARSSGWTASRS